jgi:hypothetical protein
MTTTPEIQDVIRRLDAVSQEIARMPRVMRESSWHLDKLCERRRLIEQLDRLRDASIFGGL